MTITERLLLTIAKLLILNIYISVGKSHSLIEVEVIDNRLNREYGWDE